MSVEEDSGHSHPQFNPDIWEELLGKAGNRQIGFITVVGQSDKDFLHQTGQTHINKNLLVGNNPIIHTDVLGLETVYFVLTIVGEINNEINYKNVFFFNLISNHFIICFSKTGEAGLKPAEIKFLTHLFGSKHNWTNVVNDGIVVKFYEPHETILPIPTQVFPGSGLDTKYGQLVRVLPRNSCFIYPYSTKKGEDTFSTKTNLHTILKSIYEGAHFEIIQRYTSLHFCMPFIEILWNITNFIEYDEETGNFDCQEGDDGNLDKYMVKKMLLATTKAYRSLFDGHLSNGKFYDQHELFKLHERTVKEIVHFIPRNALLNELIPLAEKNIIKYDWPLMESTNELNRCNQDFDEVCIDESRQNNKFRFTEYSLIERKQLLVDYVQTANWDISGSTFNHFAQNVLSDFKSKFDQIPNPSHQLQLLKQELLDTIHLIKQKLKYKEYYKKPYISKAVNYYKSQIEEDLSKSTPTQLLKQHVLRKQTALKMLNDELAYELNVKKSISTNQIGVFTQLFEYEVEELFNEVSSAYKPCYDHQEIWERVQLIHRAQIEKAKEMYSNMHPKKVGDIKVTLKKTAVDIVNKEEVPGYNVMLKLKGTDVCELMQVPEKGARK